MRESRTSGSGVDYEKGVDLRVPVSGSAKARAQEADVYRLTLDMAKELAMVENNERGRLVRS
jgi:anti-repressor protein